MEMDRRSFLKTAGAAGAVLGVGALAACTPGTSASASASASSSAATSGSSSAESSAKPTDYMTKAMSEKKWTFEIPPEKVPDSEIKETIEADIIVIGAGVAGLTCAAAALQAGGDVRMFTASTVTVSRGGSNHGINTKVQQRHGINYTRENITGRMKREIAEGSYLIDMQKWHKWINNSEESMNWLIDIMENAGFETTIEVGYDDADGVFTAPPASHNFIDGEIRSGAAQGQGLVIKELERIINEHGVQIDYQVIAQYLIRENDNKGRVSAVVAKTADGAYVKYVGRKAIVMATGDFSQNKEMMAKYCPWVLPILADLPVNYDVTFSFGGLGPGDGQKMGLWVGAAWQRVFPNAPMIDSLGPAPYTQSVGNHSGINLNIRGERFMNEDTIFSYSCLAGIMQPEMTVHYVWDSAYASWFDEWTSFGSTIPQTGGPKGLKPEAALAAWDARVERGTYIKADTIDGVLSQLKNINVETAKRTIERYNTYAAKGFDEEYLKNAKLLAPIKTAPFYGCSITMNPANFLCITGGLRTNVDMQVCEEDDTPIEGLYNIGIMVGDMYANCYNFSICGHNLGACCNTFSYMLGRELAAK